MAALAGLLIFSLIFAGAAAALAVALAVAMSFWFTRRSHLAGPTRSPAELKLPFEDIRFQTADGLTLHGWWIPAAGSERALIQVHGHGASMDTDLHYVPAWHAAGLNVCLFDLRGHGRSPGPLTTFGYLERLDAQAAARFAAQAKGMRRIALLGFSLGGMTALLAAPISPEVNVVIEDGAPVRICSALKRWGVEHHLPRWCTPLLAWMTVCGASLRLRTNLFRYEPVRWASQIAPRPLMIIHGEQDPYCPDLADLLQAAPPTEIWRLAGVGHTQASQVYPEEYRRRVLAFLNQYL